MPLSRVVPVLLVGACLVTSSLAGSLRFSKPRHKSYSHAQIRQPRAHVYTDCTGAGCESSRLVGNITTLEKELGDDVKHELQVKCKLKGGKPCEAVVYTPKLTEAEKAKSAEAKTLKRIASLGQAIKAKKLNEHVVSKLPGLLKMVKAAMKEYDIGVIRKAAKLVAKRSSPQQTKLDDIAAKLKVLTQTQPEDPEEKDQPEEEEEDEDESPSAMPLDKRIAKLEDFGQQKLQERLDELKKNVSPSGPAGSMMEKLPLKMRIKMLEKKIKETILKRVKKMELMQHDELVARVEKLEKLKLKMMGVNIENPDKPGTFIRHKGPGDVTNEDMDLHLGKAMKPDSVEPETKPGSSPAPPTDPVLPPIPTDLSPDAQAAEADGEGVTLGDDMSGASGASGASGPSGPKVLDDSDKPVYKLSGKEKVDPALPKLDESGASGASGPASGGFKAVEKFLAKPKWQRVAELDHGAFPDIVDDPEIKENDHTIKGGEYIDMDAKKKPEMTKKIPLSAIVEGQDLPKGMEKAKMIVESTSKAAYSITNTRR